MISKIHYLHLTKIEFEFSYTYTFFQNNIAIELFI